MRFQDNFQGEAEGESKELILVRAGLFVALAATLQAVESLIPSPMPWLRLGLGNALVLSALYLWGLRTGVLVALGKVLLGSLLAGRLVSHLFLFTFSGTLSATVVMYLCLSMVPQMGFVGISVIGAAAHSVAQLFVASLILLGGAVWSLTPIVVPAGALAGVLTGIAAWYIARTAEEGGRIRSRG